MELGNQIKALRLQRGATQEALAQHLNVSPQAVSKWEREAALPDVQLLPAISAYFGVTIDALFALTDDTRMERIQNMLWDERVLDPAVVELDRAFLLEKARREPDNGRPHGLLADLENHLAEEHRARAAQYAQESLARDPMCKGVHDELVHAMGAGWPTGAIPTTGSSSAGTRRFWRKTRSTAAAICTCWTSLSTTGGWTRPASGLRGWSRWTEPSARRCTGGSLPRPPATMTAPWPSGSRCAGTGPASGASGGPWGT